MTSKISKVGASLLMLATAIGGYTKSEAKTTGKVVYQETAKSTLEKAMDNQSESSYWFPEDLLAWFLKKIPMRNTIPASFH